MIKYFCDICGTCISAQTGIDPHNPITAEYTPTGKEQPTVSVEMTENSVSEGDIICRWCALDMLKKSCGDKKEK